MNNTFSHLKNLESEAIYIIREVLATSTHPVLLYSIGKDSSVLLHLAKKAFFPCSIPFPLLHIDTTWKFKEMYEFRKKLLKDNTINLKIYRNPEALKKNINPFDHGAAHTDMWKTEGLKNALDKWKFDVAIAGARRDEEKSRAKERVFSFRTQQHGWDPRNQRPEIWSIYNPMKREGESIRVFPLSNWTELDIWLYIYKENIDVVPLYFSSKRPSVMRENNTIIMVDDKRFRLRKGEEIKLRNIRFRTLGCYPLTGAVVSDASGVKEIIEEMIQSNVSERQGRVIDKEHNSSMEKKKKQGYF